MPSINVECIPVQASKAHDRLVCRGKGYRTKMQADVAYLEHGVSAHGGFHSSETYKEANEGLITGYPGPDSPEEGNGTVETLYLQCLQSFKSYRPQKTVSSRKRHSEILLQKQRSCFVVYLGSNFL